MPSECVFEFDRPVPIYYSGETINGRISLTTTSAKSVNVVYILFEGQGKVHWEKRRSSGKNSYTEHFRSFESYFNSRTNVFGEGELPPGTHTYTFCIPLPLECPTSCVERYGKISYEVSLVVDRPWRFDNVFKRPITVLQTYNLNMYADLLLPLKNEDVKYLCCWPCSAGPIISTLTIPFGGYAPGQKINYTLCIDNQSNGNDLEGIKITLLQKYIFRATSPRQKFKEHINALATESQDQRVLRLSKREINASLLIPPVPPSTRSNRIINIYYSILMSIRTGACHKASEIEIPITIGTIPLAQSAVNPATAAQWIPQTPDTPAGAAADLPPSYDNCRPPSFETSTHIGEKFIDTEVNEHHRTDDFIPHYPMYTNFSAPSAPPPETSDAPLLQQPRNPRANSEFN